MEILTGALLKDLILLRDCLGADNHEELAIIIGVIAHNSEEKQLNAAELSRKTAIPRSTLGRHLKDLIGRGVVCRRRRGRQFVYFCDPNWMRKTVLKAADISVDKTENTMMDNWFSALRDVAKGD